MQTIPKEPLMAVLKHIAVKNADYGEAQRYLIFKHDEKTGKPVLDENGNMQFRNNYFLGGINCDPFTFDTECMELNARYGKNRGYDEIKSHHYIISYDPKDADKGLTGERAQELGLEYAAKYFPGHQALVCTHTDGHNKSGNIHTHIIINSVRKFDVEREPFMERPCDSRAGFKHHVTKTYLAFLKRSVMDMCRRENLHQVDLLAPAQKRITDREYRAAQHEKQKSASPAGHVSTSVTPQPTVFQTQKQFLRDAIEDAVRNAHTPDEYRKILLEKYGILLKESRGRFSYLHPDRSKYITDRSLGTLYKTDSVLKQIAENAETLSGKNSPDSENAYSSESESFQQGNHVYESPRPDDSEKPESNADIFGYDAERNEKQPDTSVRAKRIAENSMDAFKNNSRHDKNHMPAYDSVSIIYFQSELRLVTDLQGCIKAQQNQAYAQKVKVTNLKRMAETLIYIQEHGYDTREVLESELARAKAETDLSRKSLKKTEERLKDVNEQIHYTGQYLANKAVYRQFLKAKDKGRFRREHAAEITLYETAARFLKEKAASDTDSPIPGKLPSLKLLKEEKSELIQKKESEQAAYQRNRSRQKELNTVCTNVGTILGTPHHQMQTEKQKWQERSESI